MLSVISPEQQAKIERLATLHRAFMEAGEMDEETYNEYDALVKDLGRLLPL